MRAEQRIHSHLAVLVAAVVVASNTRGRYIPLSQYVRAGRQQLWMRRLVIEARCHRQCACLPEDTGQGFVSACLDGCGEACFEHYPVSLRDDGFKRMMENGMSFSALYARFFFFG